MYSTDTLDIRGYRDELVPNKLLRQHEGAEGIGVVFPGMGYTCDMPLLYYSTELLLLRGMDVLLVQYDYNRPEFKTLPEEERRHWFVTDVTSAYRAGREQGSYDKVTLVGKSIGTLGVGYLVASEDNLGDATAIWLTPLLRNDMLREQIGKWAGALGARSLFAIGTNDPDYEQSLLDEVVAATKGEAFVLDGADHSLEFKGDLIRSLKELQRLVGTMQRFLAQE